MQATIDWKIPELLLDLADFAFRPICLICREPVKRVSDGPMEREPLLLCPRCEESIGEIPEPYCPRCGSPAARIETGTCRMCARLPGDLGRVRSAVMMKEVSETLVHQFKYQGWKDLAETLAMKILSSRWSDREFWDADLLVPVPISRVRRRERGYNQSALLAERVSERVGIPTNPNGLERIEWKRPQVGLPYDERLENVRNAFSVPSRSTPSIAGRRIILVDDVITTGATITACCRALREGGACEIRCVSFGRVES